MTATRLPLTALLATPRRLNADRELWKLAALIAGLRTASNDPKRHERRDRGKLGNLINDLQGALAELALLRDLQAALPAWHVAHHLIDWDGGASSAVKAASDLRLTLPATDAPVRALPGVTQSTLSLQRPALTMLLDAKSHLHLTFELQQAGLKPKSDVAINRAAALASIQRGSAGILEVLASPGRPTAWISRLVPLADILCWELVDYRSDDIALAAPLKSVAADLWGASWSRLKRQLETDEPVITLQVLQAIYTGAITRFDTLRDSLDLADHSYTTIAATATSEANACYAAGASGPG
jgi:hypothetical protein